MNPDSDLSAGRLALGSARTVTSMPAATASDRPLDGSAAAEISFDVLITPPAPLGRRAYHVLVISSLSVALTVATLFALGAAWPLTPLPIASWAVLLAALQGHRRQSARWERLRLEPGALHLSRGMGPGPGYEDQTLALFGLTLRAMAARGSWRPT